MIGKHSKRRILPRPGCTLGFGGIRNPFAASSQRIHTAEPDWMRVKHAGAWRRYTDLGGSGLGLAIARRLVEAHGGVITATSRVGGGATIRLVLPLRQQGEKPGTRGGEKAGGPI